MAQIDFQKSIDSLAALNETSNSIDSSISIINEGLDKIKSGIEKLESYNKALSEAHHDSYSDTQLYDNEKTIIRRVYDNWKIWEITGFNNISSTVANISTKATSIIDSINELDIKTISADAAITIMQTYNVGIEAILAAGIELPQDFLEKTFAASNLSEKIAWDEYAADREDWVGISDKNIQWWTDKPLKFEKDPNGIGTNSWLVWQQDENGNWVGMGFTDEETALGYAKAFGSELVGFSTEILDSSNENIDAKTAEILAGLGIALPTTASATTSPVEWMSKAEKEKWENAIISTHMDGKDKIIEYDSTISPGAATRKIEHPDGSFEYEYDSDENPEHMKSRKVEKDGSYKITYDSEKRKDGKESETGDPRTGEREMEYDSDKGSGYLAQKKGRQTRKQFEEGNYEETYDPEKNYIGMTHEENNADGSFSRDYDPTLRADGRTHYERNTDGSTSSDFDPEKNSFGMTHEENNADGSESIDYDPDKSFEGIKHFEKNADGSSVSEYDTDKDIHRRTHSVQNADGSSVTEYDPDKRPDGLTRIVQDADGNSVNEYDPEKNPDGLIRDEYVDGSFMREYDPEKNPEGMVYERRELDGSKIVEYKDGTIREFDHEGNLISDSSAVEETTSTKTTEAPKTEETTSTKTTEAPKTEETTSTKTTEAPKAGETTAPKTTEAPKTEETTAPKTTEAPKTEETTAPKTTGTVNMVGGEGEINFIDSPTLADSNHQTMMVTSKSVVNQNGDRLTLLYSVDSDKLDEVKRLIDSGKFNLNDATAKGLIKFVGGND